jgi:hypothetical protein
MKPIICGLILCALAAATPNAPAVINGQVDVDNAYPAAAGGVLVQPLVNFPPWDQIPAPWIGGSGVLIHPRVVLTAAHVVEALEIAKAAGNPTGVVRVSFGPDAYDPSTWLEIETFHKHPDYRSLHNSTIPPGSSAPDVGVLILKEPVTHISPVRLPEPFLLNQLLASGELQGGRLKAAAFTVAGYGVANANNVVADGLRRVGTLGFLNLRHSRLDCAGIAHDHSGTRQGDSGGPIFWTDPKTGERHLVATVTGWDRLETHSRIDLPHVLGFLEDVISLVE